MFSKTFYLQVFPTPVTAERQFDGLVASKSGQSVWLSGHFGVKFESKGGPYVQNLFAHGCCCNHCFYRRCHIHKRRCGGHGSFGRPPFGAQQSLLSESLAMWPQRMRLVSRLHSPVSRWLFMYAVIRCLWALWWHQLLGRIHRQRLAILSLSLAPPDFRRLHNFAL